MMNVLFLVLLFAGAIYVVLRIAKEKDWKLPAGLAAIGTGLAGWFTDLFDKVGSWF